MPVNTKISVVKGTETALIAIVSCGVSLASVYIAKKSGITMTAEIQASAITAVTAVLTGLITGIRNFWTHRKLA
jgi:hypothetical protein